PALARAPAGGGAREARSRRYAGAGRGERRDPPVASCARGRQLWVRQRSPDRGGPGRVGRSGARPPDMARWPYGGARRHAGGPVDHHHGGGLAVTRRWRCGVLLLAASVVPTAACAPSGAPAPAPAAAPRTPREVSLPDLSRMDPPVQQQVSDKYAVLQQRRQAGATGSELG